MENNTRKLIYYSNMNKLLINQISVEINNKFLLLERNRIISENKLEKYRKAYARYFKIEKENITIAYKSLKK